MVGNIYIYIYKEDYHLIEGSCNFKHLSFHPVLIIDFSFGPPSKLSFNFIISMEIVKNKTIPNHVLNIAGSI